MLAIFSKMAKKLADKKIKETTKNMNPKAAAVVSSIITTITTIITALPIILITTVVVVAAVAFDWLIEVKTAKANSSDLYSNMSLKEKEDDMTKVIQIKKNDDGEYYLDFVDDIDKKLEKYINKTNNQAGYHTMPEDVEFLKKIIQSEVCMKFPDLGGKVPEDSSGFQGVVDIRRATPDKDIGEMENTGQGEKHKVDEEEIEDPTEVSYYEEIVQEWKANQKFKVINTAIVYKERESKLHKDQGTGVFDIQYIEGTEIKLTIAKGNTVTYTGNYKAVTNPLSKGVSVYVEVKYENIKGYIEAYTLVEILSEEDESDTMTMPTGQEESDTTRVADYSKVTSRSKNKTIGKQDKTYTVAIAAGHNNTDNTGASAKGLVEQDLTVKVAEKVEEILKDYSNIKVVQTGSTSSNPGGVKLGDRKKLAREANPDLCIQIHFNAGGGTGSEAIYKKGDGISQKLAEVLSKTISESMGIKNRGDGSDIEKCSGRSLSIIENAATSGFPSVVTEGAFLDGNPDNDIIKNQNGIEKYAQGIVNGIDEYFQSNGKGNSSANTTATNVNNQSITSSIKSVVKNLKYKPLEEFKALVNSGNKEVLNYFTLDKENKLITATWSMTDGTISIEENPPVDFATSLKQYIVPFEYLLFFYMDTNYKEFSEALAEKVLKSEVVVAVQDNVTTTKEVVTTQTKTEASDSSHSTDWTNAGSKTTLTEEVSTSIDITYIDTWFVKTYTENSYSAKDLGMGKKNEVTTNIDGKVTETDSTTLSSEQTTGSGTGTTGEKDEEGNDITYTYTNYQREKTDTNTISNEYQLGDTKTEGKENTFVKLYQKHEMHKKVRTDGYLFSIIENNEKTANLLNLTKYLIYKATGIDEGVIEYDFGEFELEKFNDNESSSIYSSGSALLEYLKAWEGHEGLSPNKKKYKIGLVKGNRTVGYGIDLEKSGLEPRFKKAGYSTNVGDYVDVEFVDNLTKEVLKNRRKSIISLTSKCKPKLNEQQLDALTVVSYQYGNIGNFVKMYKEYGNTEELRNHCQAYSSGGGLNPNGYYFTTKIGGNPESNGRCDANWKLFHKGIYTDSSGKEIKVTMSASGGTIVENAVKVHEYVRKNGYYYQQAGIHLPNTKTKTIDCSSYVTWVLIESKVKGFKEGMYQWNSSTFASNPKGWKKVKASDAQPGDIAVYSSHVEIIAKNDPKNSKFIVYNCGGNSSIKAKGTNDLPESSTSGHSKSQAVAILRPSK